MDYTGFTVCMGKAWQQLGSIMGFLSTSAHTHKQQHTNTLISPQTSRLAVTKQSTYPVLAVRGKLQQSSSSVKDTYPLTSSSHKSQRRRIEGEREGEGGKEYVQGSATLDRDEEHCSKAG